jgi:hypothetical protein
MSIEQNVWLCSAIVKVGYWVGEDEIKEVTNTLFQCKTKVPKIFGEVPGSVVLASCRTDATEKMEQRLHHSLENYGVIGIKRWVVRVGNISVKLVTSKENIYA